MIFKEQLKRIGYWRMLIGGFGMYLSVPFLIMFHLINIKFFLGYVIGHTLAIPKLDIHRFLVIDRHHYSELSFMDKVNCVFCGYANGLAAYFEARMSQIYLYAGEVTGLKKLLFQIGLPIYKLSRLFYLIHGFLLYRCLIFKILNYGTSNLLDARSSIRNRGLPTKPKSEFIQKRMPDEIVFAVMWSDDLEQIESAWCPIKHIKKDAIYPDHHANFYPIEDLGEAVAIIKKHGSTSRKVIDRY